MSDLFIKGMKMPSCCMFCPLSNCAGCGLTNPPVLLTQKEMLADRPDWCPLVPAADVRPAVRGEWGYRWKIHGDGRRPTELFPCSVCGFENTSATNFCPNCGADMREES